jgi:hypothetical protein
LVAGGAVAAALALPAGVSAARSATLCVGGPGCFSTVQAAVDAASDGDTIRIGPGSFAGGVSIAKSVSLVGVSAGATRIKGGGPVLTIFRDFDPAGLAVSIRDLTITGGLNNSGGVLFGGGIWIPTGQISTPPFNTTGATVSITNSAVVGNRVESDAALPPGGFCGPSGLPCGFTDGGGIDNGGILTITNSRISDNEVAPGFASGVGSGGISNHFPASLTLSHSWVTGNRAVAGPPNGRRANAGGIGSDGRLTIDSSVVSGNSAELQETFPSQFDQGAFAGGIEISEFDGAAATITNSIVSGNRATATSTAGDTGTFAGGILDEGSLTLARSTVSHNQVSATATGSAFTDGGGLEVDGVATISDTLIAANRVTSTAGSGDAFAAGGGLANAGQTTMQRTLVVGNSVSGQGGGGVVQGGGIWNGRFDDAAPLPQLTLTDTAITGNRLSAGPGPSVQGGGLFTIAPVTRTRTVIAGNRPDQCFGC